MIKKVSVFIFALIAASAVLINFNVLSFNTFANQRVPVTLPITLPTLTPTSIPSPTSPSPTPTNTPTPTPTNTPTPTKKPTLTPTPFNYPPTISAYFQPAYYKKYYRGSFLVTDSRKDKVTTQVKGLPSSIYYANECYVVSLTPLYKTIRCYVSGVPYKKGVFPIQIIARDQIGRGGAVATKTVNLTVK